MDLSFIKNITTFSDISVVVLDIIVVTYIIYKILSIFQHTSAASIIKGLVVVFAVDILADLLHLNALGWLIQQVTQVALVAIVIVFQPELRKGLERLGRGNIFNVSGSGSSLDIANRTIDSVVKAAFVMSMNRIGALIVFERDTGTSNLTEIGVPINADVSYELLMNIFVPNTPLHDGAVIVSGNKITRAACVLPLSIKTVSGRKIGTRHRAALGITDETDAISLVVSEETGIVSLAKNGEFSTFHNEADIKNILESELLTKQSFKWLFKRGSEK